MQGKELEDFKAKWLEVYGYSFDDEYSRYKAWCNAGDSHAAQDFKEGFEKSVEYIKSLTK